MNKRHRIFVAINLPESTKKKLADFEQKYANVPAKWIPVDNLHITTLFLGDITDQDLSLVCQAVKEVALRHNTFNVVLEKIASGPEDKIPPRYIFASGQALEPMQNIKKELEDALFESINFKLDKNVFTPHVTLAKIKELEWRAIEPEERQEVGEDIALTFTVESIEVMESQLKRGGPQYAVIESHFLQ